jgi:phosphatidylinositol 4-kinase
MVVLMGGRHSQGYQLFQNLTVKAFLSIRPYAEQIVDAVQLMLDTGLPSFKGETTIRRLRDRFALHLNERQAAELMMGIIRNAHENVRSTAYDEFQRVSNRLAPVCALLICILPAPKWSATRLYFVPFAD